MISLFIENVLGFYRADAVAEKLEFRPRATEKRYGIRNFKFGEVVCDIIVENGVLNCRSSKAFTLSVNGTDHPVPSGESQLKLC